MDSPSWNGRFVGLGFENLQNLIPLQENLFVRNIFDLGPPQLGGQESSKSSRFERVSFH